MGLALPNSYTAPLFFFKMACKQNSDCRCVLVPAPCFQHLGCCGQNTSCEVLGPKHVLSGAGAKTCLESRIKKFTPHCICRYGFYRSGSIGNPLASDSHLDLFRAPYALYSVKYVDLVSLCRSLRHIVFNTIQCMKFTPHCICRPAYASDSHLDLGRAPYVLYGVKFIGLVPPAPFSGRLH